MVVSQHQHSSRLFFICQVCGKLLTAEAGDRATINIAPKLTIPAILSSFIPLRNGIYASISVKTMYTHAQLAKDIHIVIAVTYFAKIFSAKVKWLPASSANVVSLQEGTLYGILSMEGTAVAVI